MLQPDLLKIVTYCKARLDLATATLPREYFYQSLPLCIIDAVFSIGVSYVSTSNTVEKFCKHFGLEVYDTERLSNPSKQLAVKDFIKLYKDTGVDEMARKVYRNLQRTSTANGILKAEAVLQFSQVLDSYEVNYFQDIGKVLENSAFENDVKRIRGQGSGISTQYFFMLAGSENLVKPDRMILRFMGSALGKTVKIEEVQEALATVNSYLLTEYPDLTPRKLDYLIWNY